MKVEQVINVDPEILGGTPVFLGTRVPVETLFDHLESGLNIEDFRAAFPMVQKEQVEAILEMASKMFRPDNLKKMYEAAA